MSQNICCVFYKIMSFSINSLFQSVALKILHKFFRKKWYHNIVNKLQFVLIKFYRFRVEKEKSVKKNTVKMRKKINFGWKLKKKSLIGKILFMKSMRSKWVHLGFTNWTLNLLKIEYNRFITHVKRCLLR